MTALPVKGAVLAWARKFRGLSEKEAAEKLGISAAELKAYENDKVDVTIGAFENFAAKYRLPQATLFRGTLPTEPKKPEDFRTIGGKKAKTSFEFSLALSKVRTWLAQYDKIVSEDDEFRPPNLPRITLDELPHVAGERERKRFGVSAAEQMAWPRAEAFRRWRAHLETKGIIVFQQKYPLTNCKGFTIFEAANTPAIVVNRTEEFDVAKIFTLAHEYCHLLLRQPGISSESFDNPVEAFCNKFAAAFLIPTDALRMLLPTWPNQPVNWKPEHINDWASRLKVSRIALALRLEQLGIAPDGFHRKFVKKRRQATATKGGDNFANPVVVHLSEIGGGYTKQIMEALDRRVIDEVEATQALGLGLHNLEKAREALRRHAKLAELG